MKKTVLLSILSLLMNQLFSQNADSVTMGGGSPSYPYDVYYDIANHQKDTVSNTNWHIAFALRPAVPPGNTMQSTTIRLNDGRGVALYKTSKTSADWSSLKDTTGLSSMPALRNSNVTWDIGAFNADFDPSNMFDYGWGQYDMSSHDVRGTKLYILSIGSGSNRIFKKMAVNAILFDSIWDFTMSNLDGSDSVHQMISKNAYGRKLFVFYNAVTKTVIDREPSHPWDLLFTYYRDTATFTGIPQAIYPFMGVLSSPMLSIGRVIGTPKNTSDTSNVIQYSRNISTIGWDWKRVYFGPPPTGPYDMTDSLSYFIKRERDSAHVYKLYFTGFNNTPVNNIVFNTWVIDTHVGLMNQATRIGALSVYPNPSNEIIQVELNGATQGLMQIRMMDMTGKEVMQSNTNLISGSGNVTMNVSELKTGIYFISVSTSAGTETHKLMIK